MICDCNACPQATPFRLASERAAGAAAPGAKEAARAATSTRTGPQPVGRNERSALRRLTAHTHDHARAAHTSTRTGRAALVLKEENGAQCRVIGVSRWQQ